MKKQKEKDFKEENLSENMIKKKAKKKVTRTVKKKSPTKRKKPSSAGYKKAKKAISNLKRYGP